MLGMVRIYWLSDSAPQTPNKKTSIMMLVFFVSRSSNYSTSVDTVEAAAFVASTAT